MGRVYVEGVLGESPGEVLVSTETVTCLALQAYLRSPVEVFFLPPTSLPTLSFTLEGISLAKPLPINYAPPPASFCTPPVIALDDGISCVSGLSAVLRQICKESGEEGEKLLGFRNSCLAAPCETSPFVWFCEVAAVGGHSSALDRLEHHLSLPVRVHNAGKYKSLMAENGRFVEGPHFLLTDVVLVVAISIILKKMETDSLENYPHISQWFSRVNNKKGLGNILSHIEVLPNYESKFVDDFNRPLASLYKRDPTRYKPRHKIFTQQSEIESCLELVSPVKMMDVLRIVPEPLPDFVPLPDVPSKRKERKSQQIHSFISAVLRYYAQLEGAAMGSPLSPIAEDFYMEDFKRRAVTTAASKAPIVREGDTVVDFCSGSGHVGLALASCLPSSCKVILLDAKEGSLMRARQRISELGLENVWLVQANLGYFSAKFQLGMALHACGVASDLVLQKCLDKGASIVLCPCCYGGIQSNDKVKYPHSEEFRGTGLSERGFIVLGHCADQSGEQGERSMLAVDTDRCLAASEKGYKVQLTKMEPLSCSTRNNLILAVKP